MKKVTKIFFDTEFTGLHKNTTLISIGLVSECGKKFYAELTDFDKNQIDDWLEKNVIRNLIFEEIEENQEARIDYQNFKNKGCINYLGNTYHLINVMKEWFNQFEKIEIWSDCLSYDWVLFNNIFGNAFSIPDNIFYIPFDICTLFKIKNIDPDINREDFIKKYNPGFFNGLLIQKHNALFDAIVIKECYKILEKI